MSIKKTSKVKKTKKATPKALAMRRERIKNMGNRSLKTFGDKLRKARIAKGLSQRELSLLLGVTQPCVCNLENAVASPSSELKAKIAKHLGIK